MRLPLIRCELISPEKYTDWLKQKLSSNLVIHWTCVPDCFFYVVVHLTIKLCWSCKVSILDVVVLVCLHTRIKTAEGEIAAVDHDVFENV
jgi:hypothetical protein